MKPGDLVRVYTIVNTHVEHGAYAIIVRKSVYDGNWWVVYVMKEDKLFTFHTDQLRLLDEEYDTDSINIRKSYQFFDED